MQNIQYDTIMREYNRRQLKNQRDLEERCQKAYSEIPRLREIDDEVATCSAAKARALLTGTSTTCDDLKSQIALLAEERTSLLLSKGYPADYLEL